MCGGGGVMLDCVCLCMCECVSVWGWVGMTCWTRRNVRGWVG